VSRCRELRVFFVSQQVLQPFTIKPQLRTLGRSWRWRKSNLLHSKRLLQVIRVDPRFDLGTRPTADYLV
jgi:hypothetical protein